MVSLMPLKTMGQSALFFILVSLSYSQTNYAMEGPVKNIAPTRVEKLSKLLDEDNNKGILYLRQMIGQCIALNNADELEEHLSIAAKKKVDLKVELNLPSKSNLPFLYKVFCFKTLDKEPEDELAREQLRAETSKKLAKIIKLLLQNDADPNFKLTHTFEYNQMLLKNGYTAAHLAVLTQQSLEVFGILAQHNTDFSQTAVTGLTPLKMARTMGETKHNSAIEIFIQNILNKDK